jgi:alpha-1,6-mannosyltransferase
VSGRTAALSVLDISEYYGTTSGGVRTYLHEKGRYVAARPALRQALVVPGAEDALVETDGVRCYHLRGPHIPFQKPYRFMLGKASVARIMDHERPDIIEAGSAYFVPWLVRSSAARLGIPVVWFYHGHLPRIVAPRLDRDSLGRWALSSAAVRYVRMIARQMSMVLVASEFARNDLDRFGITNTRRVPLGVDADTFHPGRRQSAAETRERWQLGPGPLVLYTGRLTLEKQLMTAVRAWQKVRTPGATLLLVGAGPQAQALRSAAGPNVRFIPFVSSRELMADLYAAADLYLAPGPAETFGLSAHEAMASGTPVLSVDEGAVAEQVRRSGAGWLYPLGDEAGLANQVDTILAADVSASAQRAREFIEIHHRWDAVFDQIFAIYRTLLSARPARA